MTALLRLLPPRRSQYRVGRRVTPTGCIVLHTAETAPDFTPPDGAAENVAKFIQARTDPGSYHNLVDSDSIIDLVELRDEAFHDGTGSNPWSIGLSFATFAKSWAEAPDAWVEATIRNGAEAAARNHRWLLANGHPGTAPQRITKAQSDAGASGFIPHGDRDPGRRYDPGPDFPWERFLNEYARLTGQQRHHPSAGEPDMLKDFIAAAYVGKRGYDPFQSGRDIAGAYWWLREAAEENPGSSWTWAACLSSPKLAQMVALLLAEK